MAEHQPTIRTDDVAVRHVDDDGYISGMTFMFDGHLLVTDLVCQSIKLINTNINKIIACLLIQEPIELRDVVRISSSTAAIAIPDKKILQEVSVIEHPLYTSISLDKSIDVYGQCYGVDYNERNATFVVSYYDTYPKIEILSRTGSCLQRWDLELINGKTPRPLYVRFGKGGNTVFVSDNANDTVSMFSEINGEWTEMFSHSSEHLKNPRGIIVLSDNKILVSCRYSNRVLMLSHSGQLLRTVVSDENGLKRPCALALSVTEQKLFVSAKTFELTAEHWGNLKVFKLNL